MFTRWRAADAGRREQMKWVLVALALSTLPFLLHGQDGYTRLSDSSLPTMLPRLDAVTRTEWLLYGLPPAGAYAAALGGLVVYGALLAAAGLVDFYRRSA